MSQPLFRGTNFMDDQMRHAAAALEAAHDQIVRQTAEIARLTASLSEARAEVAVGLKNTLSAQASRDEYGQRYEGERLRRLAAEAARDEAKDALRDVADFKPLPGQPDSLWCWCGYDTMPKTHFPFCLAARRVLAPGTGSKGGDK